MCTIDFYDANADRYFALTRDADMSVNRAAFLRYLPRSGRVLDAGCGSGRDALAVREAGFDVEAFDASAALARLA
jgi:SAM-dependent methyltransferase